MVLISRWQHGLYPGSVCAILWTVRELSGSVLCACQCPSPSHGFTACALHCAQSATLFTSSITKGSVVTRGDRGYVWSDGTQPEAKVTQVILDSPPEYSQLGGAPLRSAKSVPCKDLG